VESDTDKETAMKRVIPLLLIVMSGLACGQLAVPEATPTEVPTVPPTVTTTPSLTPAPTDTPVPPTPTAEPTSTLAISTVEVPEAEAIYARSEWQSACLDGTSFLSRVFSQNGFAMEGAEDQAEDGWWFVEGIGESKSWGDPQAFSDYWTEHEATIVRFNQVLQGDVMLYDVDWDTTWDYTALVVGFDDDDMPLVSGRGSVSCNPSDNPDSVLFYYVNPGSFVVGLAMPYDD
jgi:hypothetical protein